MTIIIFSIILDSTSFYMKNEFCFYNDFVIADTFFFDPKFGSEI